MDILCAPFPMLGFILIVILYMVNVLWDIKEKKGDISSRSTANLAALVGILIIVFVMVSDSQDEGTRDKETNSVTESTDDEDTTTSMSEEELEEVLTHSLKLPIEDAVLTVGDNELRVLDNFDSFVGMADAQNYSITARQNLTASISTPDTPYEFYMFEDTEEEGTKYYVYSYVENMSKQKVEIPLGYARITELLINFDIMDNPMFVKFDSKSTYDDIVKEWGKEEYINGDEYCWSTEWGHIFLCFNEDKTIHTIDLYIHPAYHNKAILDYSDETLEDFKQEVAEEKEAYEKRQEEAAEAAKNVNTDADSDDAE